MNNEESEVKVTQEIPLITGAYSGTTAAVGGTTSPFQTIQREEVGTILKVTPHISEGNTVQLKIEQEDSSPGAKLTDSADISTNKRSIKTTILIEDGGVIVLGGLMSDTVTESEDRVPGLGAIPILGNLFKSRSGSRQKKNLMVFIRPRILRDDVQTESLSEEKYNGVRQDQKTLNGGHITLLPGETQPVIHRHRCRRRRGRSPRRRRRTRRAPPPCSSPSRRRPNRRRPPPTGASAPPGTVEGGIAPVTRAVPLPPVTPAPTP